MHKLASCPSGPVTAHGVGILTEMHVIYIERYILPKIMSIGPLATTGEAVTDARKARKYIRICLWYNRLWHHDLCYSKSMKEV